MSTEKRAGPLPVPGEFWLPCIKILKTKFVFVQFFLTIRGCAVKIDSVWCTLRGSSLPLRFIFIRHFPEFGVYASWRFVLIIVAGDPPVLSTAN